MNIVHRSRRILNTRRQRVVAFSAAALIFITVCCGREWVARSFEKSINRKLHEHGLVLEHRGLDWTPWRGLRVLHVKVRHHRNGKPLFESGNVEVRVPIRHLLRGSAATSHWRIRHAGTTLHDTAGSIRLEKVSLAIEVQPGEVSIRSLEASKGGLVVSLTGRIRPPATTRVSKPLSLDLQPLRATLALLEIGKNPFVVSGEFTVDATSGNTAWHTKLQGHGSDVSWQGIPLTLVDARAELSSGRSRLDVGMTLPRGSTSFAITREGGWNVPSRFAGTLADRAGRTDKFEGTIHGPVLRVERLEGPANLWEIAEGLPSIAPHLPGQVAIRSFPDLLVKGVRWDQRSSRRWTVETIQLKEDGAITAKLGSDEVTMTRLRGRAGYDGSRWNLSGLGGRVFGGSFELDGKWADGRLSDAHVAVDGMRWADLARWAGPGGREASKGILHLEFRGGLDLRKRQADGRGGLRFEKAPVLQVPLLDQTYRLFAAMIPGVKPAGEGRFDAAFTARPGVLEVTTFRASGGSVTVSAAGTVDLEQGRVDGRARGKLSGLPGLVTGPLGRLLEMKVAGPYSDIRVTPLGPAKLVSNTASTALEAPVETLEETGKIAGTILIEGIKLPFRLFSKEPEAERK